MALGDFLDTKLALLQELQDDLVEIDQRLIALETAAPKREGFHFVSADPVSSLGSDGDAALHTVSGDIWRKDAGIWINTGMSFGNIEEEVPPVVQDEILWPSDANFINVKNAPYNAAGDGVTNDTAAIRSAIAASLVSISPDTRFRPRCVYLPEGTYLITDSLVGSSNGGPTGTLMASLRMCGAGVDRTKIKLANNSTGYGNAGSPKNVLQMGYATLAESSAYANHIEHLTIEIGTGNPGAIAIEPNMANHGQMGPLRLDGSASGRYGINHVGVAGAGYLHDIEIIGFDYAINGEGSTRNNYVFEDITITNPNIAAMRNASKNWLFVDLTVSGAPKVFDGVNGDAALFVINGTFSEGAGGIAIDFAQRGYCYLRNVTCTGYGQIVQMVASNHFVGASTVVEWASENYYVGETSTAWSEALVAPVSFNLEIKKFPQYHPPLNVWANANDFAGANMAAKLQAAIDSGAEVVYVPWQATTVSIGSTVIVRNACRRLDFMYNELSGAGTISVQDGTGADVSIENMDNDGIAIVKATTRPVSVRNGRVRASITNTASGELYLTDIGPHANATVSSGATAWLRQWNRETNPTPTFTGAGTQVLMLGVNHESKADGTLNPAGLVQNGAVLEAFGGAADCKAIVHPLSEGPFWSAASSYLCCTIAGAYDAGSSGGFADLVNDNFGGNNYDLLAAQAVKFSSRLVMPLYISPHRP